VAPGRSLRRADNGRSGTRSQGRRAEGTRPTPSGDGSVASRGTTGPASPTGGAALEAPPEPRTYPADSVDPEVARRDPWPLVGLAGTVAFLLVALAVNHSSGLVFDAAIATAVQGLPIPVGTWEAITALGGPTLVIVGTVGVIGLLGSGRIRLALTVAAILIGASLFTDHVKDVVERPRPPGEPLVAAAGYSFPSGHALNSTVTYGLLALVAVRSRLPLALRRLAVAVGVIVPVIVGLSRVALGVHYPSDVIAGWLAGLAFVALGAVLITWSGALERDHWPGRAARADPASGRR
jgi:membrane-associated phospholipid phosphatase